MCSYICFRPSSTPASDLACRAWVSLAAPLRWVWRVTPTVWSWAMPLEGGPGWGFSRLLQEGLCGAFYPTAARAVGSASPDPKALCLVWHCPPNSMGRRLLHPLIQSPSIYWAQVTFLHFPAGCWRACDCWPFEWVLLRKTFGGFPCLRRWLYHCCVSPLLAPQLSCRLSLPLLSNSPVC